MNNAWLTGFIEADGGFNIKGFTKSPKTHIGIQFNITQRKMDISSISMISIMSLISKNLNTTLKERTFILKNKKFFSYSVTTSNKLNNQILINYLNKYSLKSSKYLDFKCWERASHLYYNKLHKKTEYLEEIRQLKLSMNNNRKNFNWNHLEN